MRQFLTRLLAIKPPDEETRRQSRLLILLILVAVGIRLIVLVVPLMLASRMTINIFGAFVYGTTLYLIPLFLAYRNQITLGGLALIAIMVVGMLVSLSSFEPALSGLYMLVFPLLNAGLVLRPRQIWLVLLLTLGGAAIAVSQLPGAPLATYSGQMIAITAVLLMVGVALGSFLAAQETHSAMTRMRAARTAVEQSAAALEATNSELERRVQERTAALTTALREVEQRETRLSLMVAENEQQRTTIREMSLPVLPVTSSTMVIPLIGSLDTERLQHLQAQALHALQRSSVRYLVIDITGVMVIDSQAAQGIIRVVQSTQLLGAEAIIVGVRPEVAQEIVGLGLSFAMRTFADLQSALHQLNAHDEHKHEISDPIPRPAPGSAVVAGSQPPRR